MNFACNKANSASYDCSFCQNIVEVCEKCCLYQPDDLDFSKFLDEISQLTFLISEDVLLEDDRNILRTFYKNNEKPFLVCNQLWLKFGHEFFYLENNTIKFAVLFEINKVETLSKEIKKLVVANTRVTVLSKSFF